MLVTGAFGGSIDFGGGPLVDAGLGDAFVVKLSHEGVHLWSQRFGGDTASQAGQAVATDAALNVWVTGPMSGTMPFGTGVLEAVHQQGIFLLKLEP